MADTAKTNNHVIGDLVKWEVRREYCRIEVALDHVKVGAIAIADPIGYPVQDDGDGTATLLNAANQANCNAICLTRDDIALAQSATLPAQVILRRGPGIYNSDILHTVDYDAAGFTQATLITALLAEQLIDVPLASPVEIQVT